MKSWAFKRRSLSVGKLREKPLLPAVGVGLWKASWDSEQYVHLSSVILALEMYIILYVVNCFPQSARTFSQEPGGLLKYRRKSKT